MGSKGLVLPALKRMIKSRLFPGALKRSFPRLNAGAPTTNPAVFQFPRSLSKPLHSVLRVSGLKP